MESWKVVLEIVLSYQIGSKVLLKEMGVSLMLRLCMKYCVEVRKTELSGAVLDLSKGFDSVPLKAIDVVLRAYGVSCIYRNMVKSMYEGITTCFKNWGGFEIVVSTGVKQGDPLSPLLFNILIDPMLANLEQSDLGFSLDNRRLLF